MPTAASDTFNLTTDRLEPLYEPEQAKLTHVKLVNSVTYNKGQLLGQITASGLWSAYNNANVDGTEVAKRILQYTVTVDASGNHSFGPNQWGTAAKSVPAFYKGTFKTSELTGLDAAGVADLGRLISGTVADGVLTAG
jgi:hypothetical protein